MAVGSESLHDTQTDGFLTDSSVEDNESLCYYPLMSSTKIEEEGQNLGEIHVSQIQILAADFYTYLNRRSVTLENKV